jgi:excisionase family DNA binding protein
MPDPSPLAYSIPDAARLLGASPGHLYGMARRGEIRLTRLGRRTLVTHAELERVLQANTETSQAEVKA